MCLYWSEERITDGGQKMRRSQRVTARAFLSAYLGMLAESMRVGRATVPGSSPQAGCAFPLSWALGPAVEQVIIPALYWQRNRWVLLDQESTWP